VEISLRALALAHRIDQDPGNYAGVEGVLALACNFVSAGPAQWRMWQDVKACFGNVNFAAGTNTIRTALAALITAGGPSAGR